MLLTQGAEENRRHSTPYVPYSLYDCRLPEPLYTVPMHWHSEFELDVLHEGMGTFICGDEKVLARTGDLLILPPNTSHAAYPTHGPLFYSAFVFHPSMLGAGNEDRCTAACIRPLMNGTLALRPHITGSDPNYAQIHNCTHTILSCAQAGEPRADLLLKSELLRLFWFLENDDHILYRKEPGVSCSQLIRPALEYMMDHFREEISVRDLAATVHMSQSYFMSCFKKAVGMGAIRHLTQLRIRAACDALSGTEASVSDIAADCGYGNLSNFNRQFQSLVGCTPREYRRRCAASREQKKEAKDHEGM